MQFYQPNFFTIGHNNRGQIIGKGKEVWNYFYGLIEHFKQADFCTKLIPRNFVKNLFAAT